MNETPFLTDDDYRVVIGEQALKTVLAAGADVRAEAEQTAIEQASAYLRPRFDAHAAFAVRGEHRNRMLVRAVADIAIYHLVSAQPQKMGMEIRRERYDTAISWLEAIASGRVVPDLPADQDPDGEPRTNSFDLRAEQALRHNW